MTGGTGDDVIGPKAQALAAAVEQALPGWVERSVERLLVAFTGAADPATMEEARSAGRRAAADVGARVRALLETDVDDQRTNPLAVLRTAVRYPTEVLARAGVPAVARDDFAAERFPDDVYDLSPAAFADVDPALHQPGLEWGAAKAWAHMQRHGRAGRRPGGPS
ncbi:MAG TPA: hypothetical protein VM242_07555 [Acidimicrobiales bacterium]|nr:hypothetical protein [Acidimicrobiales bacterium]